MSTVKTLVCESKGSLEVIMGDVHSAEALEGNIVSVEREDQYRYYGTLRISGSFIREPGLSGKRFTPYMINKKQLEVAVLKENVEQEQESDFWARWIWKKD